MMAIVSCSSCDKLISSHTRLCPHCGFQLGDVAEEDLREFRRRKLRDRVYHLKNGELRSVESVNCSLRLVSCGYWGFSIQIVYGALLDVCFWSFVLPCSTGLFIQI